MEQASKMGRESISFSVSNGEAKACSLTQGGQTGSYLLSRLVPSPCSPVLASLASVSVLFCSSGLFGLHGSAQPDLPHLQMREIYNQHAEAVLRPSAPRAWASTNDLRMETGTVSCPPFFIRRDIPEPQPGTVNEQEL